ncbi:MAG: transporter [Gemmatimonadota bacterium]
MIGRFVVAMSLLAASTLSAQSPSEPISTDRPDFTESSTLVPRGRVQFESGVTFSESSRNSGAVKSSTYPEFLFRFGVSNHIELRAGQSFTSIAPTVGQPARVTGRDDLYLGFKIGLVEQRGSRPEFAILAQTTLATGDSKTTASGTYPGLALLAGWQLAPAWSLALGVEGTRVSGDAYEVTPSASLGRALSSHLKGYAELYTVLPVMSESGAPKPAYANGGLALLLSNNAQIDARIGAGLGGAADRYFFGFGFGFRR